MFKIVIDPRQFEQLREVLPEQVKPIMKRLATHQIANLHDRAKKGVGLDDRKMPGYSKSYQRFKAKRGRNTSRRDLIWTGRMMGAMVVVQLDSRTSIQFSTAFERRKAEWNQRIHPFFGVSRRDLYELQQDLKR